MARNERIKAHTAPEVNEHIEEQSHVNVLGYAAQDNDAISKRIDELDKEWDIERTLMTGAGINVLFGVLMGAFVNRKWFYWPAIVASFMLQHTIQGWCPPLIPMRRSGVRTRHEIEREKTALRILRGDFQDTGASDGTDAERAEAAWRASDS